MKLEDFYAALLPRDGVFALFNTNTKAHVFFESQEQLVAATAARSHQANWFFCTASLERQSRKADAVYAKRCLYLDIDCGPDKFEKHPEEAYPTRIEGASELVRFAKETGLRPTIVVSSGAGLHVYYALDDDVDAATWSAMAHALRRVARDAGLLVDSHCTTDLVRVLRPVGSLHYNGNRVEAVGQMGPVWGVDELHELLEKLGGAPKAPTTYRVASGRSKLGVNDDALASREAPSFQEILLNCPAAERAYTEQAQVAEPLWRLMLGVTKFTREGESAAHWISRQHPEYDPEATTAKFEAYRADPPTCDTIASLCNACSSCPHRGKIHTPMVLGYPKPEVVLPPQPPAQTEDRLARVPEHAKSERFTLTPKGLFARVKDRESGEWGETQISTRVFWLESVADPGTNTQDNGFVELAFLDPHGEVLCRPIQSEVFSSRADAMRCLLQLNLNPVNSSALVGQLMHDYIYDQFTRVQAAASRPTVRTRFGVVRDARAAGGIAWAFGPHLIREDGTIQHALLGADLRDCDVGISVLPDSVNYRWNSDVWDALILPGARSQAEYYKQTFDQGPLKLGLAAALSSTMMLFVADEELRADGSPPPYGFTYVLYSRASGLGKSTAMKDAARAFGGTDSVRRAGKKDATPSAIINRAAMSTCLPLLLDEVTDNTPEDAGWYVKTISGGVEKDRANTSGRALRTPRTWSETAIMSTNRPVRELIAAIEDQQTTAIQMRVLEIQCDKLRRLNAEQLNTIDSRRATMLTPYQGCLGAVLAYYTAKTGYAAMRAMGQRFSNEYRAQMPDAMETRFFAAGYAAIRMTMHALEEMGVPLFDMQEIRTEFLHCVTDGLAFKRIHDTSSPARAMERMLSALSPHIVISKSEGRAGVAESAVNAPGTLRMPLAGREVQSSRLTYITMEAARRWAAGAGMGITQLIEEWKAAGLLREVEEKGVAVTQTRIDLGQGLVGFAKLPAEVLIVNKDALAVYSGPLPDNVVPLSAKGPVVEAASAAPAAQNVN